MNLRMSHVRFAERRTTHNNKNKMYKLHTNLFSDRIQHKGVGFVMVVSAYVLHVAFFLTLYVLNFQREQKYIFTFYAIPPF